MWTSAPYTSTTQVSCPTLGWLRVAVANCTALHPRGMPPVLPLCSAMQQSAPGCALNQPVRLRAGDIRRMPPGVTWRIINSTFRCTGNDTHPLPSAAAGSSDDTSKARFATAMVAAMAALVAGAYWMVNRNGAWVAGGRGTGGVFQADMEAWTAHEVVRPSKAAAS